MSIPLDHHYLPVFYLKRWADADDGQVVEYHRPHKRVVTRRRYPTQTGKARGLYSLPGFNEPELQQQVELRLMGPVDDAAAKALSLIEQRAPLDAEMRDGWARFVMSLLHRSPERMRYFGEKIRGADFDLTPEIRAAYELQRGEGDPGVEDYLPLLPDHAFTQARAILINRLINSKPIGQVLVEMEWSLIRLDGGRHGLLTSDDPVMMSNGLNHERSFIMLPISPSTIFIAARSNMTIKAFSTQDHTTLEAGVNDAICQQAEVLVIGHSDRHCRFVENRLGRRKTRKGDGMVGRFTWQAP